MYLVVCVLTRITLQSPKLSKQMAKAKVLNCDLTDYNKCVEEPGFCLNGATCEQTWTSARCHCTDLYQGDRCDEYGTHWGHIFVLSVHWRIQGGREGRAPRGSKFFHFHAVFGKNLKNNSNFESWRTPLGKILDPLLVWSWLFRWQIMS